MKQEQQEFGQGPWESTSEGDFVNDSIFLEQQPSFASDFESILEQPSLQEYSEGLGTIDLLGEDDFVANMNSVNDLFEDRPLLPKTSGGLGMPKAFSTNDLESYGRPMSEEISLAGREEAIATQAALNLQQQQQRQENQLQRDPIANMHQYPPPGIPQRPGIPMQQPVLQPTRQQQGKRKGQQQRPRQGNSQSRPLHLANSNLNPVAILPRQSRQGSAVPFHMQPQPMLASGTSSYGLLGPQSVRQQQVQPIPRNQLQFNTKQTNPPLKSRNSQTYSQQRQQPNHIPQFQGQHGPPLTYIQEEGLRPTYSVANGQPLAQQRPTTQPQQHLTVSSQNSIVVGQQPTGSNAPNGSSINTVTYTPIHPQKHPAMVQGGTYMPPGAGLAPIAPNLASHAPLETDISYVGGMPLAQRPRSLVMRRVQSTGDLSQMGQMDGSGEDALRVGKYSAQERASRIRRYKEKKEVRNFSKKIKYACRKTLADSRPRIRGRFARNDEMADLEEAQEDNVLIDVKESNTGPPLTIRGS